MCEEEPGNGLCFPEGWRKKPWSFQRRGNIGVAYTYNEPLVGYEYVLDTAALVPGAGMKNVIVTNGSVTEEVLEEILPFTDAMNIGFKRHYGRLLPKPGRRFGDCKAVYQKGRPRPAMWSLPP